MNRNTVGVAPMRPDMGLRRYSGLRAVLDDAHGAVGPVLRRDGPDPAARRGLRPHRRNDLAAPGPRRHFLVEWVFAFLALYSLMGAAGVAILRGQPARVTHLFGAAEAVRKAIGHSAQPLKRVNYDYEDFLAKARGAMGEAAFEAAFSEAATPSWRCRSRRATCWDCGSGPKTTSPRTCRSGTARQRATGPCSATVRRWRRCASATGDRPSARRSLHASTFLDRA